MAKPTTYRPSAIAVSIGDGASPEVFAAPCGLTARNITFTGKAGETVTYDCDDPDLPGWVERAMQSRDCQISVSGVLASEAQATWRAMTESDTPRNVRFAINPTGYWEGAFLATNTGYKADQTSGQKVSIDTTLVSDGPVTWVPA